MPVRFQVSEFLMPVYRAMSSSEGTTIEAEISPTGDFIQHQAEDVPDYAKARSATGLPKAVASRDDLQDSDYVLIIDPVTGQRYETDWRSAKMSGLDAYVSISDKAVENGRKAAQELPRGELNEAGRNALQDRDASQDTPDVVYEPERNAALLADTLQYHGELSPDEVDNVVNSFITQDLPDEEIAFFFQERGLDRHSLQGMIDTVWRAAEDQAKRELSKEDFEFLSFIGEQNTDIHELILLHGWKVSTGKTRISWPQFAQQMRQRVSEG
ncbi:hypothetical protein RZ532_08455 [Nitratireductor aquimarinus]|uniref:hypothetical protein n=1 Tax=Nitratireductor aquimarinus TaxID=889300 RepID=UPI00293533F1|nr:hypothetical protein [Nitratireductor aquimarinus]MDV2966003.1 hypothetical protein [Nitratireductor aquimarinus]